MSLKTISGQLLCIVASLLFNCTTNNPIVHQNVTAPEDIRPVITIEQDADDQYATCRVYLYDEDNNAVSLVEGGVYVGSQVFSEPYTSYEGQSRTYYSGAVPMTAGRTYAVSIELSGGSRYECSITTPATVLCSLKIPAAHPRAENLSVTWQNADESQAMELRAAVSGPTRSATYVYSIKANAAEYILGSDVLNSPADNNYVSIHLYKKRTGSVSRSFMSGGSITYSQSISASASLQ